MYFSAFILHSTKQSAYSIIGNASPDYNTKPSSWWWINATWFPFLADLSPNIHSPLKMTFFQYPSTVFGLSLLHHKCRFLLFSCRIRIFFFTTLLKYPSWFKVLLTTFRYWERSSFTQNVCNSVKLLRFSLTRRKSCRLSCSVNAFGRFSSVSRSSYRLKKL